ncbi:MAG: hypothetical protein GWN85_21980, partial [Gemmatimonadetes bacterium]|nr:hypothetical protein [Gemmatimonadota bacterium]
METARSPIRLWFYSSLIWLAVGPAVGAFQSLQFLAPAWMDFTSAAALPY